jgi:hypothetical protein
MLYGCDTFAAILVEQKHAKKGKQGRITVAAAKCCVGIAPNVAVTSRSSRRLCAAPGLGVASSSVERERGSLFAMVQTSKLESMLYRERGHGLGKGH